ncbi:MAG: hypothetical protein V7761_06020 [Amylibacter sp.]
MTEPASSWTDTKESGALWQLRLMHYLARKTPSLIVDPLLWLIALFFALDKRRSTTQASAQYLRRILNREPTLLERQRHALAFSHVFLDRVRLLSSGLGQFSIEAEGQELVSQLVSQGRGAVLLGAHFGSFEALRAFDQELPGLSVRYLMYPNHAQKSTTMLDELAPEMADKVISLTNGPMAMIEVFEALNNGEFVAILGDRLPDKSVRAKVSVQFLGNPIDVPTSPYMSAMAAKVPIILSVATWLEKDKYAANFSLLHDGSKVPRSERKQQTLSLAQSYASALEDMCHRNPYNWFNFFDIWGE